MRKKIVAGNWKMNKTPLESLALVNELKSLLSEKPVNNNNTFVVIAPPFTSLIRVQELIADLKNVFLGAQNCHSKPKGAFTGEISAQMLKDAACAYVIIGHSERRSYFNEQDDFLSEKVNAVLENNMQPIFCCGEVLSERQSGKHKEIVYNQLKNALFHLSQSDFSKTIIAYEPVWAIGTGITATPEEAQEMHAFIRGIISAQYGIPTAENLSILYGGSCNAKNAKELFQKPDVDGGLIGGASLLAEDFVNIIHSL